MHATEAVDVTGAPRMYVCTYAVDLHALATPANHADGQVSMLTASTDTTPRCCSMQIPKVMFSLSGCHKLLTSGDNAVTRFSLMQGSADLRLHSNMMHARDRACTVRQDETDHSQI